VTFASRAEGARRLRRILKKVGKASQREIEDAVRDAPAVA